MHAFDDIFDRKNEQKNRRRRGFSSFFSLLACLVVLVWGGTGCDGLGSEPAAVPHESRTYQDTVLAGNELRTFLVHVPGRLDRTIPLVLAFHGRLGQGEDQLRLSGMNETADANGFIVLYPDGENREWDAGIRQDSLSDLPGDDMAFVDAMIEQMSVEFPIDPRRIYATGMSNGASFVHRLACERPNEIAAVAAVASTMAPAIDSTCRPSRPISVLQISGLEDPIVPYEGNLILESVDETVTDWASRNGCEPEPTSNMLEGDIEEVSYASCALGTEVVLFKVANGGHTWPGGWQYAPVALVGETSDAIDASQEIWSFFADNPLP